MVPILLGVIALLLVVLAGVVSVTRELGRFTRDLLVYHEAVQLLPPFVPSSPASRVLRWLTQSSTAPLPFPAHGASPSALPLNCHVASQRPARGRR